MNTVRVDLSFEQLKQALLKLPPQQRMALWRLLDEGINRATIARRFDAATKSIRKANANVSEDEVMADAIKATRVVRVKTRHAQNRC